MCLAVPMKVIKKTGRRTAAAVFGNIEREVNIELLENVRCGDYVITHAGVAIAKLDAGEAEKQLELLATLEK